MEENEDPYPITFLKGKRKWYDRKWKTAEIKNSGGLFVARNSSLCCSSWDGWIIPPIEYIQSAGFITFGLNRTLSLMYFPLSDLMVPLTPRMRSSVG